VRRSVRTESSLDDLNDVSSSPRPRLKMPEASRAAPRDVRIDFSDGVVSD
jgi:hypothetical protein